MSNTVNFAHDELRRVGLFDKDSDYGGALAEAVMELISLFAAQAHSGSSASMVIVLFGKLAAFKVYEWCSDWYAPYDAEPTIDPRGPETGSSRVVRGGSWLGNARIVRAANRDSLDSARRYEHLGFRLAASRKVA